MIEFKSTYICSSLISLQATFRQRSFNHGKDMLSHMFQSFYRARLTGFINLLSALTIKDDTFRWVGHISPETNLS
jgi:hypothetical protein